MDVQWNKKRSKIVQSGRRREEEEEEEEEKEEKKEARGKGDALEIL